MMDVAAIRGAKSLHKLTAEEGLELRAEAQDAARKFEKLFVQELMAGLRKTAQVTGDQPGMFGEGPGSDTYAQWFDQHLADHMANHGRLGVAETLMGEFERWKQIPPAPQDQPPIHATASGGFDVTA